MSDKGIRCPRCGGTQFDVLRTTRQTDEIARRRRCLLCGERITTTEISLSNATGGGIQSDANKEALTHGERPIG